MRPEQLILLLSVLLTLSMVLNAFTLRVSRARKEVILKLMMTIKEKQDDVERCDKTLIEGLNIMLKILTDQQEHETAERCRNLLEQYNHEN